MHESENKEWDVLDVKRFAISCEKELNALLAFISLIEMH